MTQQEWGNLISGDTISKISTGDFYYVTDIAEDERTLRHWHARGCNNYNRIIRLERLNKTFEGSHTWDGDWTKYNVAEKMS